MTATSSQAELDQRELDFDPGKAKQDFRVYTTDTTSGVYIHYSQMRANQCMAFADAMEARVFDWSKRTPLRMTVREAFVQLAKFVDRSDPDIELPNLIHMLQTSERAREAGRSDWFQLV
jgi:inositol oxygenase